MNQIQICSGNYSIIFPYIKTPDTGNAIFGFVHCRPFSLDQFDDYQKHFTVMNYAEGVELKQVFCLFSFFCLIYFFQFVNVFVSISTVKDKDKILWKNINEQQHVRIVFLGFFLMNECTLRCTTMTSSRCLRSSTLRSRGRRSK